jgi:prepilin-type N-terminal cleavage/methylation domain-containing protein
MKRRTKAGASGFTLIELMIVVTIVGILSIIAVVGYRRYILSSKMGEAQATISAIRIAQEAYKSERGLYANLGDKWCPMDTPTAAKKHGWDPACNGGKDTWQALPVHVDGPVSFAYATWAGTTTFDKGAAGWVTWPDTAGSAPWYIVMARCDLDEDASTGPTELVGSSFQNTIFTHNDGL